MRSKQEKSSDLEKGEKLFTGTQSLVLVDFSKTPARDMNSLRRSLESIGGKLQVMKKTLFGILFKKKEIPLDISKHPGQMGAIFSQNEISEPAGIVARFLKERKDKTQLTMVWGYDFASGRLYDAQEMMQIGNLPTREVLLAQFVGMVAAPLRSLLYVLKSVAQAGGIQDVPQSSEASQESLEKEEETQENQEAKKPKEEERSQEVSEENTQEEKEEKVVE